VPDPSSTPHAVLVTAVDTEPLCPSVDVVLEGRSEDFMRGLRAVTQLTDGATYLCAHAGSDIDAGDSEAELVRFDGVHPAGSVGLHIHLLDPAHRGRTVWHIGYQDVIALGGLLETGALPTERVISLAGPAVREPRLIRTTLGASIDDLVDGELVDDEVRVLSGSVLSGRRASGDALGYLGRYHRQISALREGRKRELLGWLRPGPDKFSILPAFVSALFGRRHRFDFTTAAHGGRRAMVPIGMYERVMPFDLMPTHLLRALVTGDAEWAEELGCLELDEEDLALCTFVCPGKVDYGPHLRKVLDVLEADG
jgi:Na+-transporting NADH:ubiquinone oxidoreductase subunit A